MCCGSDGRLAMHVVLSSLCASDFGSKSAIVALQYHGPAQCICTAHFVTAPALEIREQLLQREISIDCAWVFNSPARHRAHIAMRIAASPKRLFEDDLRIAEHDGGCMIAFSDDASLNVQAILIKHEYSRYIYICF